jgi:dephospho-CoA kinase
MKVVGLTGGIASGKSFVIAYLKKLKIPVHESDEVVNLSYKNPTKKFINYLSECGFEKAIQGKKINKKIIREQIFANSVKKNKLEKFLHEKVNIKRSSFLKKNKRKKIIFLDIPLLFEKKMDKICDYICSTVAPIKLRKSRALQRKGMNKKVLNKIIEAQVKDALRKKRSNYLINTSKTKSLTCLQVDNIIYDILKN